MTIPSDPVTKKTSKKVKKSSVGGGKRSPKPASKTRSLTPQEVKDLYHLDEVDKTILKTLATYPSITQEDLAKVVGYSRSGLSKRLKKPSLIRARERQFQKFNDVLEETQLSAIRRLQELIRSTDENIAIQAVRTALAPMLAGAPVNPEVEEKIFRVQIGETGRIVNDVIVVKDKKKERPANTLDLLNEAGVK